VHLTVRNGKVTEADLKFNGNMSAEQEQQTNKGLLNRTLHEIHDWEDVLSPEAEDVRAAVWMNIMLGVPAETSQNK
jgi:hypothetical protein